MRDLLITLIVVGAIPATLYRPYIGILVWSWISYMNPHRLAYGFAYSMPFAQMIAVALVLAFLFNRDKQKIPLDRLTVTWGLFLLWMCLTTAMAIYPDSAMPALIKIIKIQAVTVMSILFLTNYKRVEFLIWTIVLSIGFFSFKGGLFTLATGGGFRVWGPPGSFIQENNSLALATLMVIPLIYYLYTVQKNKWIKYGLMAGFGLSLISALGSQSRGAFIASAAVLGFYWLKTKGKLISGLGIVMFAVVAWNFMPAEWHERMSSIQDYQEDRSAMGRINAWIYSINIANHNITGGGFNSWGEQTYAVYNPSAEFVAVAHSIYFSVLADHGWIGLLLFLLCFFFSWRNLTFVIRHADKGTPEETLAKMLQVSYVAYFTGGAFLSLSYFDLPWHLIAISVLMKKFMLEGQLTYNPPKPRFPWMEQRSKPASTSGRGPSA
jgi:putative inorganic carbon (HCO3(-)) transporter